MGLSDLNPTDLNPASDLNPTDLNPAGVRSGFVADRV